MIASKKTIDKLTQKLNLVCGKNSKLRSNLVQLDRIQLALKQHKIKQKSFKIHFSNEIKMIFDIIKVGFNGISLSIFIKL